MRLLLRMHDNFVSASLFDSLQCFCCLRQSSAYLIWQRENIPLSQCLFKVSPKYCRTDLMISRIGHDIFPRDILVGCNHRTINRKRPNNQASLGTERASGQFSSFFRSNWIPSVLKIGSNGTDLFDLSVNREGSVNDVCCPEFGDKCLVSLAYCSNDFGEAGKAKKLKCLRSTTVSMENYRQAQLHSILPLLKLPCLYRRIHHQ